MNAPFTITEKNLNLLTGQVSVKYGFGLKNETKEKAEVFKDLESANAYLAASARDWFLGALEDYINHKAHIINASHPEQKNDLTVCQNAYNAYTGWALENIVNKFLGGYSFFVKILPSHNNASYASSLQALNNLKVFCETYLKTLSK